MHERDVKILKKALEIVERAQAKALVLRIMGAVAVYLHISDSDEARQFYESTPRLADKPHLFTDIDLVGYSKQRKGVAEFFEKEMGFLTNPRLLVLFGGRRLFYEVPGEGIKVDVFFDKLEFSHDVFFGERPGEGRLELDYPTITPADLLLEKLQIHDFTFKDAVDVIALLLAHDVVGGHAANAIDGKYIAQVLSRDWGFWYDATNNLKLVKSKAEELSSSGSLRRELLEVVAFRVEKLLDFIEREPKSKEWVKRSKVGTKKPWYREVEEYL